MAVTLMWMGSNVSVDTETVEEGYEPPIHDFSMEINGEDYTEDLLKRDKLIMVVAYNLAKSNEDGLEALKSVADEASKAEYEVIGLTASGPDEQQAISKSFGLDFDFYFCDETALKTIVRSNPGVLKLNYGTILQKLHHNDLDELILD